MGGDLPSGVPPTGTSHTFDPPASGHTETVVLGDVGRISVSVPHDVNVSPVTASEDTTAYI